MANLVAERITAYYHANKRLPKNILYYRDGVGSSQYQTVKTEELAKFP